MNKGRYNPYGCERCHKLQISCTCVYDEKLLKQEEEEIEKYGFIVHYVPNEDFDNSPSGVNIHTHGLHRINHLDFQITVSIPPTIAFAILHRLHYLVKNGEVFCKGGESDKVLDSGMRVGFIEAHECGRRVLRVILPDPNGVIKRSTMSYGWRTAQFG